MASLAATSGCRAAVSSDTRAPPDPPTITAGCQVQFPEQTGQHVGLHLRLRRPRRSRRRRLRCWDDPR